MTRSPLFKISPHLEIAPRSIGHNSGPLYSQVSNFTEHPYRPASSFIKHNFGPPSSRVIIHPDQHPIPTSNPYRHCTRTTVYYPRITILYTNPITISSHPVAAHIYHPRTQPSPLSTHPRVPSLPILRICPSSRVNISAAIPT